MELANERFRVLTDNVAGVQYLVMSWEVNADATIATAGDNLYFGLWDDTSGSGNVYRLTRNTKAQTAINGATFSGNDAFSGRIFSSTGAIGAVTWSGTASGPPYPLPTWLTDDARVDVSCATPPTTGCDRWAFRVRAKIDPAAVTTSGTPSGLKLTGATFRFWYEVQDNLTLGTTLYSLPAGLTPAHESGGIPPIQFPDPSLWKQAKIGTGAGCDGDILFDASQVWVNSAGSSMLDPTSNAFHATPKNNVPTATRPNIPNSALTARFRIANWGSATFKSPEWKETCVSSASGSNIASGSLFDLNCTWTGFDACPYKPAGNPCGPQSGTKDPHQCVLVELGLPPGSTDHFLFSAQSIFHNMNFAVNSKLVRTATIDIQGLKTIASPTRDVYLYVHTRNLPVVIDPASTPAPNGTRDGADRSGVSLAPRARFPELELPAAGPIGTKESARIQAAVEAGRLTLDQVEQIMPTYIVYVWHDTGKTLPTAKGPQKILEPQPSYGLFLAHDGDLTGWKHDLVASGAVQVAPSFYRISAATDSMFQVTTTIEPTRGPRTIEPVTARLWWLWILVALFLLILLFVLLRKKNTAP